MAVKVVREFKAWTECPRCDHIAVHWVREARDDPPPPTLKEVLDDVALLRSFGGEVVRAFPYSDMWREGDAECVRTCVKCSHRWTEGER